MSFFHPSDTSSKIRNSLLVLAIAAALFYFTKPPADDRVWTPLLRGDSFAGWTFDVLDDTPPPSIFSIQDGVLTIKGADQANAIIRSDASYSNFELTFQWRWPNQPGNSGCLLFASTPRFLNVWPKSLEVQLAHSNAGDFIYIGETIDVTESQLPTYDPEKQSWKERLRLGLIDGAEKPVGDWNKGRILSNDGEVVVYINGQLVNKGWNGSASEGSLCLQAEGADIQYRYLRIAAK